MGTRGPNIDYFSENILAKNKDTNRNWKHFGVQPIMIIFKSLTVTLGNKTMLSLNLQCFSEISAKTELTLFRYQLKIKILLG